MVWRAWAVAAVLLLQAVGAVAAEPEMCTLWFLQRDVEHRVEGTDKAQLCSQAVQGLCQSNDANWSYSCSGGSLINEGQSCRITEHYSHVRDPIEGDTVLTFNFNSAGEIPCPSEECDGSITGERYQKVGASETLASSYCDEGSKCRIESTGIQVCLGGTCFGSYVGTDQACSGESGGGGLSDSGEDCVNYGGLEVCKNPDQGDDCGYYNDEYVCLKKTADRNRCFEHTDGSMICVDGTPLPPAPDSGTPGEGADPDAEITINEGDTSTEYQYYGPGTVGGSSRPPGGEAGIDPEDTGSGTCTGDDCGEGSGEASGGETCEAPPSCSGDPIQCAVLSQQWRNRCVDDVSDEDLESMFGPVANEDGSLIGPATEFALPEALGATGWIASDCPADLTVNLGGLLPVVTIPISEWCEWMGILGIMVMVSAYIGGIRIIVGGL